MQIFLLILFYLLAPALIIYLAEKATWIKKFGIVPVCYLIGLILGNIGIIPEDAEQYQELIMTITIPLALPLLLFTTEAKVWGKLAGRTLKAFVTVIIALLIMVYAGYFLLKDNIPDIWKISGMLVGVYTGGTPNLASIATALGVGSEQYIMTHTSDLVVGAIYLAFLLTIAQRLLLLILPPFTIEQNDNQDLQQKKFSEEVEAYHYIIKRKNIIPLLKVFVLAILIFAIGGGISLLFDEQYQMTVVILIITTLGVAFSFNKKVRNTEGSFQLGMYLILIFSLTVSSMADISKFDASAFYYLVYVTLAMLGTFIIQVLLSKILKVDADTTIIAATALSMSPPFVPVVAAALKNKEIILSGLALGIIGYVIGNYLGVFVAFSLK